MKKKDKVERKMESWEVMLNKNKQPEYSDCLFAKDEYLF